MTSHLVKLCPRGLAIRHGLKKPFVHLIDASESIPFDNAQVRTIQVDLTDLDSVEAACSQLDNQVSSIETGDTLSESPISVAFDLETLKASGKPDEAVLASVLEEISSLKRLFTRNAVVSPRPGRVRSLIPTPADEDEFVEAVDNAGFTEMASYIRKHLIIDEYAPPVVSMSIKKGSDFRDLDDDLSALMKRLTNRNGG